MTECTNADVRDRLPDYVHGHLVGAAHAEVALHLATCDACASEVALIRDVRAALTVAPTIDVQRIASALPAPRRLTLVDGGAPQRRWFIDWRVAAAVTLLAVGGGSAAILSRDERAAPTADSAVTARVAVTPSIDAYVADATLGELESLLADLEQFDGLPARDPEAALATTNDVEVDG